MRRPGRPPPHLGRPPRAANPCPDGRKPPEPRSPAKRPLPQLLAHQGDEAVADGFGLGSVGRLDHHPHQRLGAGGAQEHAAAALECGVLLLDRIDRHGDLFAPVLELEQELPEL